MDTNNSTTCVQPIIRYTLDGSAATSASAAVYTSPVRLGVGSWVVNAATWLSGAVVDTATTRSYTVTAVSGQLLFLTSSASSAAVPAVSTLVSSSSDVPTGDDAFSIASVFNHTTAVQLSQSTGNFVVVQDAQAYPFGSCAQGQAGVAPGSGCSRALPSAPTAANPCVSSSALTGVAATPIPLASVTKVASSIVHTVVLAGNVLYSFGACASVGRACDGGNYYKPIAVPMPVPVSASSVSSLAASDSVTAVVVSGSLYTWGPCLRSNGDLNYLLGQSAASLASCVTTQPPTRVSALSSHYVTAVAVGVDHVVVIADGQVFGYGSCQYAAFGVDPSLCVAVAGVSPAVVLTPTLVLHVGATLADSTVLTTFTATAVAAGTDHTVVLAGTCPRTAHCASSPTRSCMLLPDAN